MDEKARRAKNQRLKRLYGITLEDYEERLAQQNGVCAICLRPPGTLALSVDHDHKAKYLKLVIEDAVLAPVVGFGAKVKSGEVSEWDSPYYLLGGVGGTKAEAKAHLRDQLKRASVRGLLCFSCNGGLRKYRDNPDNLRRAAEYLTNHQVVRPHGVQGPRG